MNERMTIALEPSMNKIGDVFEFTQSSPFGAFTKEYEIIAKIPSTMLVVKFMRGYTRLCAWNKNHGGFRRATKEEKQEAQEQLERWAKENS